MNKFIEVTNVAMLVVLLLTFFAALFSLPIMLLWDWLMPTLFGLGTITWVQAWGLSVLCGLLFKSSNSK